MRSSSEWCATTNSLPTVAVLTFGKSGCTSGRLITQATKGVAGSPATKTQFGYSLAVDDDRLAVGAIRDDVPGARDTGAVQLFRLAGSKVSPVKRISQSSAGVPGKSEPEDWFGSAVAFGRVCPGVTGLVVGASSEVLRNDGEDDWPEGSAWLIPLKAPSACRAVQFLAYLVSGHPGPAKPWRPRMVSSSVSPAAD